VLATKFPPSPFYRTQSMPKELDASLARLGRNSVDLYQHHFPSSLVSIPKLMDLMADAVKAGKVKAVGVSNYSAEQMRIAHAALARRGILLASNQVQYSLDLFLNNFRNLLNNIVIFEVAQASDQ